MRNRIVGFLILGIAVLIGFIIFSFNKALTDVINLACTHGTSCPMWETLNFYTNLSLVIMGFIIILALYLIFFGEEERVITKTKIIRPQVQASKITKEQFQKILNTLNDDEKLVFEKIIEADGAIFQSDLISKTNFSKVKVSRILDRLEVKGLVERRRRGLANVVVIKRN